MEAILANDDVLMEILKWLPLKSIMRFKTVSPHWKNLLSSPPFLRLYSAAHRGCAAAGANLVAFFQLAALCNDDTEEPQLVGRCNVLPVRNRLENHISVPEHVGIFVNSSNGLILCSRRFLGDRTVAYYSVGNPLTGKFVELPQPRMGNAGLHSLSNSCKRRIFSVTLICEENTNDLVPIYTLLRAGDYGYTKDTMTRIHMDSYSSKKGEWSDASIMQVPTGRRVFLYHEPAVVANGIVHWGVSGGIVVYDPSDRHLQLINMPHDEKHDSFEFTRSSAHDDILWLAVQLGRRFLFYMLPKECGGYKRDVPIGDHEWKLMHEASVFDISKITTKKRKEGVVACKKAALVCLFPESRSEVVAVLRQDEKVFLYNVQRKTLAKLDFCGLRVKNYRMFPYFEPSFPSSAYF